MAINLSWQTLTDEDRRQLEAWLGEFGRSWTPQRLGACARKLPPDSPLRLLALTEMVKIDLERQWQNAAGSSWRRT
jgi:hypothetical protein